MDTTGADRTACSASRRSASDHVATSRRTKTFLCWESVSSRIEWRSIVRKAASLASWIASMILSRARASWRASGSGVRSQPRRRRIVAPVPTARGGATKRRSRRELPFRGSGFLPCAPVRSRARPEGIRARTRERALGRVRGTWTSSRGMNPRDERKTGIRTETPRALFSLSSNRKEHEARRTSPRDDHTIRFFPFQNASERRVLERVRFPSDPTLLLERRTLFSFVFATRRKETIPEVRGGGSRFVLPCFHVSLGNRREPSHRTVVGRPRKGRVVLRFLRADETEREKRDRQRGKGEPSTFLLYEEGRVLETNQNERVPSLSSVWRNNRKSRRIHPMRGEGSLLPASSPMHRENTWAVVFLSLNRKEIATDAVPVWKKRDDGCRKEVLGGRSFGGREPFVRKRASRRFRCRFSSSDSDSRRDLRKTDLCFLEELRFYSRLLPGSNRTTEREQTPLSSSFLSPSPSLPACASACGWAWFVVFFLFSMG